MIATRRLRRRPPGVALGLACGIAGGLGLLAVGLGGAAVAEAPVGAALRDVLHTPPLLVRQGERAELRYDAVCQSDSLGTPCELAGTVFVRSGAGGTFEKVPLAVAGETNLEASVDVPAEGVSYYAVIEGAGDSLTVPEAGAGAPQRVWAVAAETRVDLGTHAFGRARKPDGRAVSARWGATGDALGLITGRELVRIGPSAFDVAPDGTVVVLDQANDRLALYSRGGGDPRHVPIAFAGAEGDLAVGPEGDIHVLDHGRVPMLRRYGPPGAPTAASEAGVTGVDMLRSGPSGPLLHGYPGDIWVPAGSRAGRPGRPVEGGLEVVVHGTDGEARLALVRGDRVLRAWRVTSDTALGEIQLAEPYRGGMLVVLRAWTETRAEFVVLVLTPSGLARSFAVDPAEWAESAALGRFRLKGETLYQLRSTESGAEIVTFDLGGAS